MIARSTSPGPAGNVRPTPIKMEEEDLTKKIAVVITSCDAYSDVWPFFFPLMDKFWPDCPFRKYLVSNRLQPAYAGVHVICVGEDVTWSTNLKRALQLVPEEYILLFVDDLLFTSSVSTSRLFRVCADFMKIDGLCLKLVPTVRSNQQHSDRFGETTKGSPYRVSTVATLWRKHILVELLDERENAWQFEIHGTRRAESLAGFYSVYESLFSLCNAIVKGKWRRAAVAKVKRLLKQEPVGARPVMSLFEETLYNLRVLRFDLLGLLPLPISRRFRSIFNR